MAEIKSLNKNTICHLVVGGFLIQNKKVLLIYHPIIEKWLPVGGHIDENETPEQSLKKEFKEEVGLDIAVINSSQKVYIAETEIRRQAPNPFYSEIHSSGNHNHHCQFFICKLIDERQKVKVDGIEVKEFKWFTKDELISDDQVGEDIKTVALLALNEKKT